MTCKCIDKQTLDATILGLIESLNCLSDILKNLKKIKPCYSDIEIAEEIKKLYGGFD